MHFLLAALLTLPYPPLPIDYGIRGGEAWCQTPDTIHREGNFYYELVVCKWKCRDSRRTSVLFYWNPSLGGWLIVLWSNQCAIEQKTKWSLGEESW